MIFLRQPNLLFIKSRKTAGTSLEIALSMSAQPGDIVTRLALPDELLRQEIGGPMPFGWAEDEALETEYNHYVQTLIDTGQTDISNRDLPPQFKQNRAFFNHMNPAEIVESLGREAFDAAYKISICRHPYEKLVSQAWFKAGNSGQSFEDMLAHFLAAPQVTNQPLFFWGKKMIVDTFIRYEFLLEDLAALEQRHHLPIVKYMPRAKSGYRKDRRPAAQILSRQQKQQCFEMCRWEFEYFGYDNGL